MTVDDPVPPAGLADFSVAPERYAHLSVSDLVRRRARVNGDTVAYVSPDRRSTWRDYDALADKVCAEVLALGGPGPVALQLPDAVEFHAALVGCYRAGVMAVAIGSRSGPNEVAHIMTSAGATVLVTTEENRGRSAHELVDLLRGRGVDVSALVLVDADDVAGSILLGAPPAPGGDVRAFSVDDVSLLNCTSGTTGRPKLVMQTQHRWNAFTAIASRNAEFSDSEVLASFVPTPFGFGLWTSHFMPALLGRPTLVLPRFSAATAIELMAEWKATVLSCVSTQFRMMLQSRDADLATVASLKVMFTGGEAVPASEARRFEDVTGSRVLQFYGSNETGAASATTIHDDDETRLGTGGRIIDEMNVRIIDGEVDEARSVIRGQPAVRGPLMSPGYWNDDAANAEIFTDDGWLLLGDVVELDDRDRLTVVGRLADLIIRGGKNISAVEVEDYVREHPSVEMVAAVGIPDPVFGERLCVVITPSPGAERLTLEELTSWLRAQGVTPEYLPEKLVEIDEMPVAPGGKIAKATVKEIVENEKGD